MATNPTITVNTKTAIKLLGNKMIALQAKRDLYREELADLELKKQTADSRYLTACKVRVVLQEIAKRTQQNLQFHISNLVTLALNTVYPQPPEFVVRFESRRNQTECDLLFKEGGKEQHPLDSGGYGLCDLVAFALRVSFWAIRKNRPVMILDEPFRSLSPDLHEKAGKMVKMVSEKLGLQFVIVSHSRDVNESADRTFVVTKDFNTETSSVREI